MEAPPRKLGPYTLLRKIGRGAFGVVWLAEKQSPIATTRVALKLPRDEDIDLEAFKQEATIWVQASGHPNVVPLIEADVYDGQVVIVSEYVPDGSLAAWLKQHGGRAPSIASACETVEGVLAGLAHLHGRRIIHRDLKPDNILLQGDTPRLTDFGIARLLRSGSYSTNISGTLAYMAPEAFDGKRNEQTDVWSVGVIFYQLLAGHLPYAQQETASFIGALMRHDPPPLPDSQPEVLRQVVARALERDPSQRYKSAAEMRHDIREAERMLWLKERAAHEGGPTRHEDPPPTLQLVAEDEGARQRDSDDPARTVLAPTTAAVPTTAPESSPIKTIKAPPPEPFSLEGKPVKPAVATRARMLWISVVVIVIAVLAAAWWKRARDAQRIELVWIPAGSFMMGSDSDRFDAQASRPAHRVTISKGFYMGKTEVTQAQWQAVMGNNPSELKGDDRPVEQVSWNDAQVFIQKINQRNDGYTYRLPTEAEWEYACRAGTTGDFAGNVDSMAWHGDNSDGKTHPVGQKQPNAFGLYDMHGNAVEWCEDWFHANYNGAPADGSAWLTPGESWPVGGEKKARVLRGGSWRNPKYLLTSWFRYASSPDLGRDDYKGFGFRVVAVQAP